MSEKRARYTGGDPDGRMVVVTFDTGEQRTVHVKHGGELPTEIDGQRVPAAVRDGLLAQSDEWSEVKRATGQQQTKTSTAADSGKDKGES